MPGQGDDVAAKIESQVRDAIMKMVSDIRSSIDDVRDAVVQQLQAAMQSVQADANALSLKPQLQTILKDATPAASPAPAAVDLSSIKRSIQAIERGTNQVEVLNALLDQSLNFGSRAALLILKADVFTGWKGAGFSATGGNDEAVKRFSAPASTIPELDRVYRQEKVVAWNGANLALRIGAAAPQQAVLIPMVIKDKIAAALYVDTTDPRKLNQAALELLVFTTGLLIDTLAIRKKMPSPSLSSDAVSEAPSRGGMEPFAIPQASPSPPPRAAAPPAAPRPAARQFEVEPTPAPPPAAARRPAPAPPPPDYATTAIPAFSPTPTPPAARPAPTPSAAVADLTERASTQYIPPAGLKGGARFSTPQPEDTKKHDEARRFARLLVSEIKLYNESKVDQGRRNKDIYERLKEDIDRSRQMYEERVPDNVRKSSNYFYDELVRILADGDADALGL